MPKIHKIVPAITLRILTLALMGKSKVHVGFSTQGSTPLPFPQSVIGWYIVYGPLKCRRLSVLDKQVDIGLVISIDVESFLPSGVRTHFAGVAMSLLMNAFMCFLVSMPNYLSMLMYSNYS